MSYSKLPFINLIDVIGQQLVGMNCMVGMMMHWQATGGYSDALASNWQINTLTACN